MDEEALNRMAIEEIVREMQEAKRQEFERTLERKVNPLGKPNKRFLGRTINSMLTHNKRESDRKRKNCHRKLKELDERADRRLRNAYFNGSGISRNRRGRSTSQLDNSSSEESCKVKKSKKKTKLKKRRKRKRHSSSSNSSSSSSNSSTSSRRSSDKYKKYKTKNEETAIAQKTAEEQVSDPAGQYYEQFNQHYTSIVAAAACNQLNSFYQQYTTALMASMMKRESECNKQTIEKASGHSSSISLSSLDGGSDSMDDNGGDGDSTDDGDVNECAEGFTIDLSTENDTESATDSLRKRPEIINDSDVEMLSNLNDSERSEKSNHCINLDTDDAQQSSSSDTNSSSIIVMSDSPQMAQKDLMATATAIMTPNKTEENQQNSMIDLTEE